MVVPLFLPMTGQTSSFHIECVSIRMELSVCQSGWNIHGGEKSGVTSLSNQLL